MGYNTPTSRSTGNLITASIWNDDIVGNVNELALGGIAIPFDGGGAAISTDSFQYLTVPFKLQWTAAEMQADTIGSIVIDIWRLVTTSDYSSTKPADSDSITASAPPTLSSDDYSIDSTLTGWTKTMNQGDALKVRVESCATITKATLNMRYVRSS